MFTIQYTNDDVGGGSCDGHIAADSNKIHKRALIGWFWRRRKKEEEYPKPRTNGRGVSYGKITTVAVTQDLL